MFGLTLFPSLLIVLALPASSGLPKKSQPSEVEQLIRQLGSESFDEREAASRRLEGIGELALEALRKAGATNDDPEVRRRAKDLVRAIERRLFGELRCFLGHDKEVTCVTFSPNGRQLLSAGADSD